MVVLLSLIFKKFFFRWRIYADRAWHQHLRCKRQQNQTTRFQNKGFLFAQNLKAKIRGSCFLRKLFNLYTLKKGLLRIYKNYLVEEPIILSSWIFRQWMRRFQNFIIQCEGNRKSSKQNFNPFLANLPNCFQ